MIVKNEAPVLARCLHSVRSAVDEIIIVDTGSVDSTIGAIRPLYLRVPRYWALYRQVIGDVPESEVPDGVVRGEIDKEETAIRRMFPS
jgi:glycosyltransferase involved in cell wall biosynthesis